MVVEARRLVDSGEINAEDEADVVEALNAMGYEEAAQHVYGMHYQAWKERHHSKATDAQMQAYQASMKIHAIHDKALLEPRAPKQNQQSTSADASTTITTTVTDSSPATAPPLASNVCCQDVPEPTATATTTTTQQKQTTAAAKGTRPLGPLQPPPIPTKFHRPPTLAVLTVSDRAAAGAYATGDLAGPAVQKAVRACLAGTALQSMVTTTAVVPDDPAIIQAKLRTWCDTAADVDDVDDESSGRSIDLILTTGGTGLAPRDVTPEATREILDWELPSLMALVVTESSRWQQPLASLSRGTAGIRHKSVIANLPGNPAAVTELLPLLLPLLLHAVADLQDPVTPEVLELE